MTDMKIEEKADDSILVWLKENLEAVVIAFIMALMIKCFCIEVFKIPTGSMEPTLHGDPSTGDRIMVNKFFYNLDEINRFDVVIFRYPLDMTKTFIKRVTGLPNEKIMIYDGDVYFNPDSDGKDTFFLAKKPFNTQQEIWIPVYGDPFFDLTEIGKSWDFAKEDCVIISDKLDRPAGLCLKTSGTAKRSAITLTNRIHDSINSPLISGNIVPDFKLGFYAMPLSDSGGIFAELSDGTDALTINLNAQDGNSATAGNQTSPLQTDFVLRKNEKIYVELMKFDGAFYFLVNGKLLYEYNCRNEYGADSRHDTQKISFGAINADCVFSGVSVYRDLYYIAEGNLQQDFSGMPRSIQIPDGCYYMLGDNSLSSKDSRRWEESVIKLKDGTLLTGDTQRDNPEGDGKMDNPIIRNKEILFRDVYGCDILIEKSRIENFDPYNIPRRPHPFVKKDEIVGKGFVVWWPPKRIKMIR